MHVTVVQLKRRSACPTRSSRFRFAPLATRFVISGCRDAQDHQSEVAEAVGLTETALRHWESNKRTPSLRFLPLVTAFVRENGQATGFSAK